MARIIVVDDSLYMRTMLKYILKDGGHKIVGEAEDGKAALELIRNCEADVITLDVILPDTSGLDILKTIDEEHVPVKVIMVTSVGQEVIMDEAYSLGAIDYIVKPFSEESVTKVVNKILS